MNISPAIIIDVALIAVIVVSVFHYARKGFVAGLMDLVGNLASLALAWVVSGKLSPTVFENFFKSGLIEQTDITASAAGMLDSGAPDIAQQVVEKIIAPLVVPLITVVVFFATFVLCRVVIAFLVTVLTNINKIPLLGGVNRILGVCIGVVAGFINVLLILCLLWAVVVITNGNLPFVNDSSLSGSCFYSFFSAYNPFL